jgi:hypothetical protein
LELKSETYEELEQWVDAEKTIADSSYMAAPYLKIQSEKLDSSRRSISK